MLYMQYFLKSCVSMENLCAYFFSGCDCTRRIYGGDFLKMKKNRNISLVKLSPLFMGVESTPCLNYGTVVTQSL